MIYTCPRCKKEYSTGIVDGASLLPRVCGACIEELEEKRRLEAEKIAQANKEWLDGLMKGDKPSDQTFVRFPRANLTLSESMADDGTKIITLGTLKKDKKK